MKSLKPYPLADDVRQRVAHGFKARAQIARELLGVSAATASSER